MYDKLYISHLTKKEIDNLIGKKNIDVYIHLRCYESELFYLLYNEAETRNINLIPVKKDPNLRGAK